MKKIKGNQAKKKFRELYMQKELKRFKEGSKLYREENGFQSF